MSVDLPEPDGPMSATNSPRRTLRSIPRSAWTALPFAPNTFVRPVVSMMLVMRFRSSRRGTGGIDKTPGNSSVVVVLFDLLAGRVFQGDLIGGLQPVEDLDALESRDS